MLADETLTGTWQLDVVKTIVMISPSASSVHDKSTFWIDDDEFVMAMLCYTNMMEELEVILEAWTIIW